MPDFKHLEQQKPKYQISFACVCSCSLLENNENTISFLLKSKSWRTMCAAYLELPAFRHYIQLHFEYLFLKVTLSLMCIKNFAKYFKQSNFINIFSIFSIFLKLNFISFLLIIKFSVFLVNICKVTFVYFLGVLF